MSTFLPLVVYLIMTLVMCPNILSGRNFKEENDTFAANMYRMFHPDYDKKVLPVSNSYENATDMLDERSMNSVRSYHSYGSDSSRDTKTDALEVADV